MVGVFGEGFAFVSVMPLVKTGIPPHPTAALNGTVSSSRDGSKDTHSE